MAKQETKRQKPGKPSDLVKGSRRSTTPELAEKDLDKVSGGAIDAYMTFENYKSEKNK